MRTTRAAQALRGVLLASVQDSVGRDDSVPYRASAALYFLLMDHPVDQRGRCRSCRRPSATFGLRRRVCRVHMKAEFWLQQPTDFLRSAFVCGLQRPKSSAAPTAGFAHGGAGMHPDRLRFRRVPLDLTLRSS
jgi:hypothetical protein